MLILQIKPNFRTMSNIVSGTALAKKVKQGVAERVAECTENMEEYLIW